MNSEYAKGEKFKKKEHPRAIAIDYPDVPITLHEHHAEKAGKHYDLRLAGKGDWAIRYFPEKPGEKRLAVRQPTHPLDYYDFEGEISSGYGKGKVNLKYSGPGKIQSWDEKKINFEFDNNKYVLINTKPENDQWLIMKKHASLSYTEDLANQGFAESGSKYHSKTQGDDSRLKNALRFDAFADALHDIGVNMESHYAQEQQRQPQSDLSKNTSSEDSSVSDAGSKLRALDPFNDTAEWSPFEGASLRAVQDSHFGKLTGDNGPSS